MRLTIVPALVAALVLIGCAPPRGLAVDQGVAADIESTGLTVYLPDLPGDDRLERSRVVENAVESLILVRGEYGDTQVVVSQHRATGTDDLCRTWSLPLYGTGSCEATRTEMQSSFEETTRLVVVRGDTLLKVSVASEGDPALVDRTLEALRSAPEVEPEDLAPAGD